MTAADRLAQLAGTTGTAAALLLAIGVGATTGEALANYSQLPSGTAAEHLLAERLVQDSGGSTGGVVKTTTAVSSVVHGRRAKDQKNNSVDWNSVVAGIESVATPPITTTGDGLAVTAVHSAVGDSSKSPSKTHSPVDAIASANKAAQQLSQTEETAVKESSDQIALNRRMDDEEALLLILMEAT